MTDGRDARLPGRGAARPRPEGEAAWAPGLIAAVTEHRPPTKRTCAAVTEHRTTGGTGFARGANGEGTCHGSRSGIGRSRGFLEGDAPSAPGLFATVTEHRPPTKRTCAAVTEHRPPINRMWVAVTGEGALASATCAAVTEHRPPAKRMGLAVVGPAVRGSAAVGSPAGREDAA
jgi:hypothetical protein